MPLDWGRKAKCGRRIHTDAKKPWKLNIETDFNPITQFRSEKTIKMDFKHTTSAWMQLKAVQGRHLFRIINTRKCREQCVIRDMRDFACGVSLIRLPFRRNTHYPRVATYLPVTNCSSVWLSLPPRTCHSQLFVFPATSANVSKTVCGIASLFSWHRLLLNRYDKDTLSLGTAKG